MLYGNFCHYGGWRSAGEQQPELNSRAKHVASIIAYLLRESNVTLEALIEAYPEAKALEENLEQQREAQRLEQKQIMEAKEQLETKLKDLLTHMAGEGYVERHGERYLFHIKGKAEGLLIRTNGLIQYVPKKRSPGSAEYLCRLDSLESLTTSLDTAVRYVEQSPRFAFFNIFVAHARFYMNVLEIK